MTGAGVLLMGTKKFDTVHNVVNALLKPGGIMVIVTALSIGGGRGNQISPTQFAGFLSEFPISEYKLLSKNKDGFVIQRRLRKDEKQKAV